KYLSEGHGVRGHNSRRSRLAWSQGRNDCPAFRTGTHGPTGAGGIGSPRGRIAIVHGAGKTVFRQGNVPASGLRCEKSRSGGGERRYGGKPNDFRGRRTSAISRKQCCLRARSTAQRRAAGI